MPEAQEVVAPSVDRLVSLFRAGLEERLTGRRGILPLDDPIEHGAFAAGDAAGAQLAAAIGPASHAWRSRTLALLKPHAIARGEVGAILDHIYRAGFRAIQMRMFDKPGVDRVQAHYAAHAGRDYFAKLVDYVAGGPVLALVLTRNGEAWSSVPDVPARFRELMGPFRKPRAAGTLRGVFMKDGDDDMHNVVHGSDSPAEALREARLWFPECEY